MRFFNLINRNKFASFCGAVLLLLPFGAIQAQTPPLSISATPTSRTVTVGQSATYTIKIKRSNFVEKIALSATNLPPGATATFSPNTTGNNSTMTITTKVGIEEGTYQINVTAAGSSITSKPITVTLVINPGPSVTLAANPTSRSVLAGHEAVYEITFNRYNFAGNVRLNASGLPANATASFNSVPGSSSRATVRVTTALALGNSSTNFTVSGTANGASVYPIVLKLRTNCNIQWERQIIFSNDDIVRDVTTDRFGNVIVVGKMFDWREGTDRTNVVVTKYYSNGTLAWRRILKGVDRFSDDQATSVVTDDVGDIFIAGLTDGYMQSDFPNQTQRFLPPRWWVAKLDISGLYMWVRQDPADTPSDIVKLALDGSNNINLYAIQSVERNHKEAVFDRNGRLLSYRSDVFTSASGPILDFAVAGGFLYTIGTGLPANRFQTLKVGQVQKYNLSNGNPVWDRSFNIDGSGTIPTHIRVDASGNIFIGGHLQAATEFITSWVRKLDNAGGLIWQKRLPLEDGRLNALEIHNDGNLLVAGNVGSSPTDSSQWLSKLNAGDGFQQWIRKIGNKYLGYISSLHSDGSGNIFIAGGGYGFGFGTSMDAWVIKYTEPAANTLPSNISTPASASAGQVVSLRGSNLLNVEEILIGDKNANFTILSSTEIRVTVPAVGRGNQVVTVRAGCESVRSDLFLLIN